MNGHTSPTRKTCYKHSDSGGDEQQKKKQTNKKQSVVVGDGLLIQAESLLLNIVHRQTKEMNSVEFTSISPVLFHSDIHGLDELILTFVAK